MKSINISIFLISTIILSLIVSCNKDDEYDFEKQEHDSNVIGTWTKYTQVSEDMESGKYKAGDIILESKYYFYKDGTGMNESYGVNSDGKTPTDTIRGHWYTEETSIHTDIIEGKSFTYDYSIKQEPLKTLNIGIYFKLSRKGWSDSLVNVKESPWIPNGDGTYNEVL